MGVLCLLAIWLGSAYPLGYWHFNSPTDPGPYLSVVGGAYASGSLVLNSSKPTYASVAPAYQIGSESTFLIRFLPRFIPANISILVDFGNPTGSDGGFVALYPPNSLLFGTTGTGATSTLSQCGPPAYSLNQWSVILVAFSNTTTDGYRDGSYLCSGGPYILQPLVRTNQYIGKGNTITTAYWDGLIDFVWHIPRYVGSNEVPLLMLELDILTNAWTFQSPTVLGTNVTLIGSPDLTGGTLNLHGGAPATTYASIDSSTSYGEVFTIVTRINFNSFVVYGRVVDFSSPLDLSNSFYIASLSGGTGYFYAGLLGASAQCPYLFQIGAWVDVAITLQLNVCTFWSAGIKLCNQPCSTPNMLTRSNQWIGTGTSEGMSDASFEYVYMTNRALTDAQIPQISVRNSILDWTLNLDFNPIYPLPTVSPTTVISGGVASFSQNTDYVSVPSSFILGSPFTIIFRARPASYKTNMSILGFASSSESVSIYTVSPTSLRYEYRTSAGPTFWDCGGIWNGSRYVVVVIAHDGAKMNMTRGNVSCTNVGFTPLPTKPRDHQYIGNNIALSNAFNGALDWIRFYQRPLTASEITGFETALDRTSATCPVANLSSLPRATIGTCVAQGQLGSTCQLGCLSQYPVQLTTTNGACTIPSQSESALWMGQNIMCLVKCPDLPTGGSNMTYTLVPSANGDYVEGQVAYRTCTPGFALNSQNLSTLVCTANNSGGYWTNAAGASCSPVNCGPPNAPTNGNVNCGTAPYGQYLLASQCNVTCSTGYILASPSLITCKANAQWSNNTPMCAPISCPSLSISNGTVDCSGGGFTFGSRCNFSCATNFKLSSATSLNCNSSGSWTSPTPTCALALCPTRTTLSSGLVICSRGVFGAAFSPSAVCTSSCKAGYSLNGTINSTCQSNGTWSVSLPTCTDINECLTPGICPGPCTNTAGNYTCGPFYVTPILSKTTQTTVLGSSYGDFVQFTVYVGWPPAAVTLTPYLKLKNGDIYFATNISVVSISSQITNITCFIPPGMGSNLFLQLPGTTIMGNFSYPPFQIIPNSLRIYGDARSNKVYSVQYEVGDIISMDVLNYYPGLPVTVSLGSPSSSTVTCALQTNLTNATTLTCQVQPYATGINLVVTVSSNYFDPVTGIDTYSVMNVPTIVAVHAAPGSNGCSNSSDTTAAVNCPTPGGANIMIIANYINSTVIATISGVICTRTGSVICDGSSPANCLLTCAIPTGTGDDRSVVVASNRMYSQPRNLLSYAVPQVFNITGCESTGSMSVINCNREGGDVLKVSGKNFGASGATVFIGGKKCTSTTHDASRPHERVLCTLPPGSGTGRHVQVFQAAGPFSLDVVTLDYSQCQPGQFQNQTSTTCGVCTVGTFSNVKGSITCATCDPGRYADQPGLSICGSCQPGYTQSERGMSYCDSCQPGSYTARPGAVSCTICDGGTFSPAANSTACQDCADGSISYSIGFIGPTQCIDCPTGCYAQGRSSMCEICPAGRFTNSNGSSECQSCPEGYYQDIPGSDSCLVCPPGFYSPSTGRFDCLACESGTSTFGANASIGCQSCPMGKFSQSESPDCIPCGRGSYASTQGQAVCLECPSGSYSNSSGATACTLCELGYSQPTSFASTCAQCATGSYADMVGRPECLMCGSGSFSGLPAATTCTACEPGSYSQASEQGVTSCTSCAPGSYVNSQGQVSCLNCPVGWYINQFGASDCLPCAPGSVSPSAGSRSCNLCSPGFYAPVQGLATCLVCPAGTYSNGYNATVCSDCPEGQFQNATHATACISCPIGQFTSIRGRQTCAPCDAGKYTLNTNTSSCTDCEMGRFQAASVAGASACQLCSPGQYASVTGRETCLPCPKGTYTNHSGVVTCTDCPAGTHQTNLGSLSCDVCEVGKANNALGQSSCSDCSLGFTTTTNGSLNCDACPAGRYRGENMEICALCDKGTSAYSGNSVCNPCSTGLVARDPGMATCESCQPNASPDKTRTTCNCNAGYYLNYNGLCISCPVGANCYTSGITEDNVPTMTGYYLADNTSLVYQRCLIPKACVNGVCVGNRAGLLCNQCEPGYTMSDWTKTCSKCTSKATSKTSVALVIILLVAVVSLLYAYVIRAAFKKKPLALPPPPETGAGFSASWSRPSQTEPTLKSTRSERSISRTNTAQDLGVIAKAQSLSENASQDVYILKVIAFFFQISSSLISLPVAGSIAFPTYYMQFLSYFKFFSVDFMPWQTVECFVPINFYIKMAALTLVPVLILPTLGVGIAIAAWCIRRRIERLTDNVYGKGRLVFIRASIFTLFLLYPAVSSRVLSHFVCLRIANTSRSMLVADFSIQCFGPLWMKWTPFVSVMVFVYPIGVPLLFYLLLRRAKADLQSPFATLGLGFLHESYVEQMWWFEVLVMVQKLILTSLLQFLPSNYQLPVGIIVTLVYLLTIVLMEPEVRQRNWILHQFANIHILLLLLIWHFSFKEGVTSAPVAIDACASALFIALTVCLVGMLLYDVLRWGGERVINYFNQRVASAKQKPQSGPGPLPNR